MEISPSKLFKQACFAVKNVRDAEHLNETAIYFGVGELYSILGHLEKCLMERLLPYILGSE